MGCACTADATMDDSSPQPPFPSHSKTWCATSALSLEWELRNDCLRIARYTDIRFHLEHRARMQHDGSAASATCRKYETLTSSHRSSQCTACTIISRSPCRSSTAVDGCFKMLTVSPSQSAS